MRHYLLLIQSGYTEAWFKKGNIYREDHINPGSNTNRFVRNLVREYPQDWEEVFLNTDESDKLVQSIDISKVYIPKIKFI